MKILEYKIWQRSIVFYLLLAFIIGLFTGKAVMSMACVAMLLYFVVQLVQQGAKCIHKPLFLGLCLYFACYALAGIHSTNMGMYVQRLQMHVPLIAFGIVLLFKNNLSKSELHTLLQVFIVLCVAGCAFTLYHYATTSLDVLKIYGEGGNMHTPFKSDHIRFSLALCIAVLACFIIWRDAAQQNVKRLSVVCAGIFSFFILFISSRTAIIALAITLICICVYLLKQKATRLSGIILAIGTFCAPVLAYYTLPTFSIKCGYVVYSLQQINNHKVQANISDEGRIISYKIATDLIKRNLLFGVGSGDVEDCMNEGYHKLTNGKPLNAQRLLPHNQFLVMWLVGGLLSALALLYMLAAFAFQANTRTVEIVIFSLLMLPAILVEPLHETQYGVAIHIFFLLLLCRYSIMCTAVEHD